MFADDTAAYAVDANAGYAACRFQRELDAYVAWSEKWRVPMDAQGFPGPIV